MTVIILTTTINVQNKIFLNQINKEERLNTYLQSIKEWFFKTSLKIIVVENSGYPFEELKEFISNRFELISFNESELPEANYLLGNTSKGASELFSISYSIKNSKIIDPSDFIIKITGRYFIEDFEKIINNYNLNEYDGLCQNNINRCEIVGCNYKENNNVFNQSTIIDGNDCNHIEFLYTQRIQKLDKVLILCPLNILPTKMGGADCEICIL